MCSASQNDSNHPVMGILNDSTTGNAALSQNTPTNSDATKYLPVPSQLLDMSIHQFKEIIIFNKPTK